METSPFPETVRVLGRDANLGVSAFVGTDWHDVKLSKPKTNNNVFNRSEVFNEEQHTRGRFIVLPARLMGCS
jgi:hypothetical protein